MKRNFFSKGFTLIELLGAVFILILSIGGITTLIVQTLSYASVVSSKLIASYLAQEGIEIVRNIRDTNWIKRADWDDGLAEDTYGLDYQTQSLPDSNCSSEGYLKVDNDFYKCSLDADLKFKRKITIDVPDPSDCPANCLSVKVEVSWEERGKDYFVTAQENLYNWYQP